MWCASFCSGVGLYRREITEPGESSGQPEAGIPSASNAALGFMASTSSLTKRDAQDRMPRWPIESMRWCPDGIFADDKGLTELLEDPLGWEMKL
jgi:hypothetical protein